MDTVTIVKKQHLEEVIEEIQANCLDFQWMLEVDTFIKILAIRKETFHKVVYSYRNSSYNYKLGKCFTEEDAEFLCVLLNRFLGIRDSQSELMRCGLFIDDQRLDEIKEYFTHIIIITLKNHELDKELMQLLISSTLSFEDAFDSYFDSKFDMELIIRRTVETFLEKHGIDNSYGIEEYLENYLKKKLTYHHISFYKITEIFRDAYYYEMFGRHRDDFETPEEEVDAELLSLLKFFNLKPGCTFMQLKEQYKKLLKKYHPDLNKKGLEKTKLIIINYKKLQLYFK